MQKNKTNMDSPSICTVSTCAVVLVILQYIFSYTSRLCENNALVNNTQEKETEIRRTNTKLSKTEKILKKLLIELVKSKDAENRLAQMNSEPYNRIASIDVKNQISFNKLQVELSKNKTKIININWTLSETWKELEKLRTEFVKSKDAESRLELKNAEPYNRIAGDTATQKRLDVKTQISFNRLLVEFPKKDTETLQTNRELSETQKDPEKLRTELFKSKDAKIRLALENPKVSNKIAKLTATQKRLDIETQISLNKLELELYEKQTKIINMNRTLSETQNEAEILRTEWVKSKDAESQLEQMNAEVCGLIARVNATQKRPDVETAAKLSATERKLARTEAALIAKQKDLEEAQAQLRRRETDTLCCICLDSERNAAFVPCGHTSTCYDCSLRLFRIHNAKCPVCRQSIHQILQIYL